MRSPIVSSNSLQVDNATTVTATSNDQNDLSSNVASINVTTMTTTTMRTTAAPFKFTRNGLQDIISRNLRGLMRLFNIEWQDALNVSFYYINSIYLFINFEYIYQTIVYYFIIIIINFLIFQQSDISVREFQRNLGNQIGSFLQDNPNAF